MKIENVNQLRELYENPKGRTLKKELTALDKHCKHFLSLSPFMVISSFSSQGEMDASPRGGLPGFAKVLNDQQLIIPDAKGNNRLDSLRNIIETGQVGALFLIPGIDETLRLNGTAEIRTDQHYLDLFSEEKNAPKTCILINVTTVFLHCAKALMRSELWKDTFKVNPKDFPTMGQILKDQLQSDTPPESREEMIKRYQNDL